MKKLLLTGLAVLAFAPAEAAIVYSNNFNGENGGNTAVNYNGFNGLTVTDGSVDLVASGNFGITCPGGGSCVDLDGSTGDAGVLRSSSSYAFAAGDTVTLNFTITGNQRGGAPDDIDIFFEFDAPVSGTFGFMSSVLGGGPIVLGPFVDQSRISLGGTGFPFDYPADMVSFFFTAANAGNAVFGFQSELVDAPPAGDNIGLILDDVSLDVTAVPEPASWAMMIIGFGLVGAVSRRRRAMRFA